jgi:glycosyltransferase involved in cell wall biosynthesis
MRLWAQPVLDQVPRQFAGSTFAAPAGRVDAEVPPVVDISVVMPAFNEQRRIGPSIEAVCEFLRHSGRTWELIVVDDGSSDLTASVADTLVCVESGIRLIRLPHNSGKGHAVRVGVLASRGDEVLMCDADLSTPIREVEQLWAGRQGAVAAIGSRAQPGSHIDVHQNPVRKVLGRLGNRYIRAVAVRGINDTQCGFKLFNGPAARALFVMTRLNGWGIDVELLHLCARFGWPVVEVPVRWSHSTGSKLRPTAYLHVLAEVAYLRLVHRRAQAPVLTLEG